MEDRIIVSGFGGQGVMLLGQFLAYAGMLDGLQVSWIPSYGPEMRGGTAYCSIVMADKAIGSPIVSHPDMLIVMNGPSWDRFLPDVRRGGTVIANSSLISDLSCAPPEVSVLGIPAQDIAEEMGNARIANMIILGCYLELRGGLSAKAIEGALRKAFVDAVGKPELLPLNRAAIERGRTVIMERN